MGAWGERAFDNDMANDWAYELEEVEDLSAVEEALEAVEEEEDYLDSDEASAALAACEVIARLKGKSGGYMDAYTEKVDAWVAAHPLKVPAKLVARAHKVIDRILGEDSELRELWEEDGPGKWRKAVEELRGRVLG